MNFRKRKKREKLNYASENLAFPEVHIDGSEDEEPAEQHPPAEEESGVVFENLAVPEIKLPHKK